MSSSEINILIQVNPNITEKKKVICPICNNGFSNKSNLKTHISSIHNKILPFKCPYSNCLKKYSSKTRLNVHIRTHTGIKPYKCKICLKSFNENGKSQISDKNSFGVLKGLSSISQKLTMKMLYLYALMLTQEEILVMKRVLVGIYC